MSDIRFWSDSLNNIEYLSANYRNFSFPSHFHENFAIGIIEKGAQKFNSHTKFLMMPEGSICVINPGMVHEGRDGTTDGWKYRMFYPSERLISQALDIQHLPFSFDQNVIWDDQLFRNFRYLHELSENQNDSLEQQSYTLIFLRELFLRYTKAPASLKLKSNKRATKMIREILHDHFSENISITQLAQATNLSETYLIRSFSAEVGLSPHAYLVALRIEKAKKIIQLGLPLTDVALFSGFSDQSHLTRHFKRSTGVTPGVFAGKSK